ncbi:hypothetical protein C0W42_21775 [Photobacterium kishitanii]|nr:hypothetical protein C0W42_21775 [Photobacterium kishitanii]
MSLTRLLAIIGSTQGITNTKEIAFTSKKLIAIALGDKDYVRDLKTNR